MSPRLVLLGDSITELSFAAGGWGAALADHFARKRWALRVVATAMEDAAADADPAAVVTVFFGANDACLPDHRHSMRSHMHVPLDEYQANLRAICGYLKTSGFWTKMQQFPDWRNSALCDGLHYTPFGNKILLDCVLETLESIGFSQGSLQPDLPLCSMISTL
uniref:SGNH hydrolase-type esterase domain-containing protein n=1 Tax=Oryza meridionalis TaxID=40149 RepID=A0A0E0C3C1_9ORYZ